MLSRQGKGTQLRAGLRQGRGGSHQHRVDGGWASRIRSALAEERLVLYSQEIVTLGESDSNSRHVEILLRILDEHGAIIPPAAFIPAAERYQFMPAIDRWVIDTVLATLGAGHFADVKAAIHTCAINLSGASLADRGLPDFIREEFMRYQVPPGLCASRSRRRPQFRNGIPPCRSSGG